MTLKEFKILAPLHYLTLQATQMIRIAKARRVTVRRFWTYTCPVCKVSLLDYQLDTYPISGIACECPSGGSGSMLQPPVGRKKKV